MKAASTGFNSRAVERLTGLTHRQLVHWDKSGFIKPSVRPAAGSGSRRIYFEDLVELRTAAELRRHGVSLQAIRKAVAYLRRHHAAIARPLAQLLFMTDGNRIFVLTEDPRRLLDVTSGGQVAFTIALGKLVNQLHEKVIELSAPREISLRVGRRSFRVVLTPDLEEGGYSVEVPELPGCFTQGNSVPEAREMAREAIQLFLEDASEEARTSTR